MNIVEDRRVTVISGAFGTGKTEVAINIALHLAMEGVKNLFLVDLDIVNLFFRSRQKAEALREKGITVISSQAGMENADLPALSPAVQGCFDRLDSTVIVDLGGSDLGGIVLSRFNTFFQSEDCNHWLVVNPYRPFNEKNEDTVTMAEHIAGRARLGITGMIANPHLLYDTTDTVIEEGFEQVRRITRWPLKLLTVMSGFKKPDNCVVQVLEMSKQMNQPWEENGIVMHRKQASAVRKADAER
ncbi:MAG: hypothetical protein PHQ23_14180 [Candidatus Wallbacteria bacterium]|nr:hypothetical protein [Candidatus Wallbacteria bacterium]